MLLGVVLVSLASPSVSEAAGCPAGYDVWGGGGVFGGNGDSVCVNGVAYVTGGTIGDLRIVSGGVLIVGDVAACSPGNQPEGVTIASGTIDSGGEVDLGTSNSCDQGGPVSLTISSPGTLTNNGTLAALECEVGPGSTSALCVGGTKTLTGNVTNDGAVSVDVGQLLDYSGGSFDNAGSFTVVSHNGAQGIPPGGVFDITPGAGATFTNDTGGSIVMDTTQQPGQFNVDSGNTFIEGAGTWGGTSSNNTPPPIQISSSTLDLTGSGTSSFQVYGSSTLEGSIGANQRVQLINPCALTSGDVSNAGTLSIGSPVCNGSPSLAVASGKTLTNTGTLNSSGATISGDIDNASTGIVNVTGGLSVSGGTFDNAGSVLISDFQTLSSSEPFDNEAGGSIAPPQGASGTGGLLQNGSTFEQGAGSITGGIVHVNGGTLDLAGSGPGGISLDGDGNTLEGNIAHGQTVTLVGRSNNCPGDSYDHDSVAGNLTNDGTLIFTDDGGGCGPSLDLGASPNNQLTNASDGTLETQTTAGGQISGALFNAGTATISDLTTVTGSYTQSAGSTTITGRLEAKGNYSQNGGATHLNGSIGNPANDNPPINVTMVGGTLDGNGSISGALTQSGGTVTSGLAVYGVYDQQANATLKEPVSNGTGPVMAAYGGSTLNGNLNIDTEDSSAGACTTFQILQGSSSAHSGTFPQVTVSGTALESGLAYAQLADTNGFASSEGALTLQVEPNNGTTRCFQVNVTNPQANFGGGTGTVTSSPAGIDCHAPSGTCTAAFPDDVSVELTETPDRPTNKQFSEQFAGWSGQACPDNGQCTLLPNSNRPTLAVQLDNIGIVNASFVYYVLGQLTVHKAGSGKGTVTSSPSGISCGSKCGAKFISCIASCGPNVTLTEKPAAGSRFTGWKTSGIGSAPCPASKPTCQVWAPSTVTATFAPAGPAPPKAKLISAVAQGRDAVARVSCTGSGATPCQVTLRLTYTAKGKTTMVGVLHKQVSVGEPQTLTVKPNDAGERLLSAHHRLTVKLTASQQRAGASVIFGTGTLTLTSR